MTTKLEHALHLAERGFHVLPLQADSKLPAIERFPELATRDPAQIRRWWFDDVMGLPLERNIGISTTRFGDADNEGKYRALLVVDVDAGKPGKHGHAELLQLELQGCEVPPTLEQQTPTGGAHLIYVTPHPVKQGAAVLGPSIDIRSQGGYIVAVGSSVGSGDYVMNDCPIAEAPEWLVARCGRPAEREAIPAGAAVLPVNAERARERAAAYLCEAEPAVEGAGGDAHTVSVATQAGDFGVTEADCLELMLEHWNDRCSPPWSPEDLAVKVANAYAYRSHPVGCRAPEAEFSPLVLSDAKSGESLATKGPERLYSISLAEALSQVSHQNIWLIKRLIEAGTLVVIHGPPYSGKTFLALDMAFHIALGWPWFGRKVLQGAVLYVAAEGGRGVLRRLEAFAKHHQIDPANVPFELAPCAPNLLGADAQWVAQRALEVERRYGQKVAVVVIDTLSRAMPGGEENGPDMAVAVSNAGAIQRVTGASVWLLHHPPKNGDGPRGHSSLPAAVDSDIAVAASPGNNIGTVTPRKVKDGELPEPFDFERVVVALGLDEDGDTVTSCIVRPATDFPTLPALAAAAGPDPQSDAGKLLTTLRDLLEAEGQVGPKGAKVVPEKQLRDAFKMRHKAHVATRSGDTAFRRACDTLQQRGDIAKDHDFIGLSPQATLTRH